MSRSILAILLGLVAFMPAGAQGPWYDLHHRDLYDVALSPHRDAVASIGHDETVKLSGSRSAAVALAPSSPSMVRFSPDGGTIAVSGSPHLEIRLYGVPDLDSVGLIEDFSRGHASAIAYSPDGTLLAAAGSDAVTLWSTITQTLVRALDGPPGGRRSVQFSADGSVLFAAGDYGIERWELATAIRTQPLGITGSRESLALSLDGRWLLVGGSRVELWDLTTATLTRTLFTSETEEVRRVAFADGDSLVVAALGDSGVYAWHRSSGEFARRLNAPPVATGSLERIYALDVVGDRLLTGSRKGDVRLWDPETGDTVWRYMSGDPLMSVRALQGYGGAVVKTQYRGLAFMGGFGAGRNEPSVPARGAFAVSRSDLHVAVRMKDRINIHSLGSGDSIGVLADPGTSHLGADLDWSLTDEFVAAAGDTLGRVKVWRPDGEVVAVLPLTQRPVTSVRFAHHADRLAALSEDGIIRIWETRDWATVATIDASRYAAGGGGFVAPGQNGAEVAAGGLSDTVAVFDVATGALIRTHAHPARVLHGVYAATILHTSCADGVIRVWFDAEGIHLFTYPLPMYSFDLDADAVSLSAVAIDGTGISMVGIGYSDGVPLERTAAVAVGIHPQPSSDVAIVSLPHVATDTDLLLVDMLGRRHQVQWRRIDEGRLAVDVAGLNVGAYRLVVFDGACTVGAPLLVRR